MKGDNVGKISRFIHFPLYVYSKKYTSEEFMRNSDGSINFFDKYVRDQIRNSKVDDLICYSNLSELGEESIALSEIGNNSAVCEYDIVNDRGGPAMRLFFAKVKYGFRLFCLMQ
jgi:hypothetical protein